MNIYSLVTIGRATYLMITGMHTLNEILSTRADGDYSASGCKVQPDISVLEEEYGCIGGFIETALVRLIYKKQFWAKLSILESSMFSGSEMYISNSIIRA